MDKKITPEQLTAIVRSTGFSIPALAEELNRFFAAPELTEAEFHELFSHLDMKFEC